MIFFYVWAGIVAYWLLACIAMATIDTDGRILAWYKAGPVIGKLAFWMLWPVAVIARLYDIATSKAGASNER